MKRNCAGNNKHVQQMLCIVKHCAKMLKLSYQIFLVGIRKCHHGASLYEFFSTWFGKPVFSQRKKCLNVAPARTKSF